MLLYCAESAIMGRKKARNASKGKTKPQAAPTGKKSRETDVEVKKRHGGEQSRSASVPVSPSMQSFLAKGISCCLGSFKSRQYMLLQLCNASKGYIL